MDISKALMAKSDQLNAVDLIGGPCTVTVLDVTKGTAEQMFNIITDVFGPDRPFRPSATVFRILGATWGTETSAWIGRRMTLFRDPTVKWGGQEVGGIRVKSLSGIKKTVNLTLATSSNSHAKHVVESLPDAAPTPQDTSGRDWLAELTLAGADLAAVGALGNAALSAHADTVTLAAIRELHTLLKAAQ